MWQAAIELSAGCYRITGRFPREEAFGMTSQIRRAAVSVAANVAEGHGRESTAHFVQFLRVAQGSLKELETHLIICERVELLTGEESTSLLGQCDEVGRMLRSLIRALQEKS